MLAAAIALVGGLLLLTACGEAGRGVAPMPTDTPAATATPAASPTPAPTPTPSFAQVRPNELGEIMVLEYHVIGSEELRWTRTRDNFRSDLDYLYRNGYYLVNMKDLLDNRVRVPAGKSPVVLTFDDSNRSQFQLIEKPDGSVAVDPASGLGILESFADANPDFGRAGVFCILPGADPPNDLFGQPNLRKRKLQYLAERGYEICNHTLWHAILTSIDDKEIVRQLALTTRTIQEAVPGYQVDVFDPPGGVYPETLDPVLQGSYEGVSYRHRAILEVTGGPMPAPDHRDLDFLRVPRIQAIPDQLKLYFQKFEKAPEKRYVSDGDPDRVVFPTALAPEFRARAGPQPSVTADGAYTMVQLR